MSEMIGLWERWEKDLRTERKFKRAFLVRNALLIYQYYFKKLHQINVKIY